MLHSDGFLALVFSKLTNIKNVIKVDVIQKPHVDVIDMWDNEKEQGADPHHINS